MEKENLSQLTFGEEIKITNNRSVYNKCYRNLYTYCPICAFNRGCNRDRKNRSKNWKEYRKTQYKIK